MISFLNRLSYQDTETAPGLRPYNTSTLNSTLNSAYIYQIRVFKPSKPDPTAPHPSYNFNKLHNLPTSLKTVPKDFNLDTGTPTGKLMLTTLAAIATFEREMMLERQHEGIRFAKEKGKYKGRKPTARVKSAEVLELIESGKSRAAVAKEP